MMKHHFVIITGLSGAGKSILSGILEDLGYFCVDNLPTTLIPKFAEICLQSKGKINKIALVIDIRERMFLKNIAYRLNELSGLGIDYQIIFLEASEEILIRRYSETRRLHPLDRGDLLDGIRREKKILRPLRSKAHIVINTSDLNIWALKEKISNLFGGKSKQKMPLTIITFGFKFGIPIESDLVFDLRFLPNPYYEKVLKKKNGFDKKVKFFVIKNPTTTVFLGKTKAFLDFLIPKYQKTGKPYLTLGLGCTGGRHRSVVIAEYLGRVLRQGGQPVKIVHRDIERHE